MRQFLLLLSGSARRPGPFTLLKRNELLKDHVVQRVENVSDRTPLVSKNFFFPQAVFPAFRESHLEVYGYLELTLDFLPSLYRRQRSKPVRGGSKKRPLSSVEKSQQHHFLNFPTTSLGLGSARFRWRACVRQTQHSQFWRRCVLFRPPLVATLSLRHGSREQSRRCCGLFLGDLLSYPGDCTVSIPAVTTIFAVTGSEILLQLLWRRVSLQAACQVTCSQRKHHFRERNGNN